MPIDARIPMQGENSVDFSPILRGVQQGQQIAANKQSYELNELKTKLAQLDTAGKLAANVTDVNSLNTALDAGKRFGVLDDKFINSVPRDERGVKMINSLYQQSEGYKNDLMAQYKAIALGQKTAAIEDKNFTGTIDEYNNRNQAPAPKMPQQGGFDPMQGLDTGEVLSATEETPMPDALIANQPPLKDPAMFMPKKAKYQAVLDNRGIPIVEGGMQVVQDERGNRVLQPLTSSSTTIDPVTGEVVGTPKLSGTEQKDLFKSTDTINGVNQSIESLTAAKDFITKNKDNMYSGTGSEILSGVSNVPILNNLVDKDKADNTQQYNNYILTQAYSNLKATFGSNPTEGERKALQEVQAMSGKNPEVQAKILDNAINLANIRKENELKKAKAIVNKDYGSYVKDIGKSPIVNKSALPEGISDSDYEEYKKLRGIK